MTRPNLVTTFAMLLVLAGCEANTAPAAKTERPVQVQRVTFENENAAREFVGVVRARYETDLGFRVAGKIVARVVNVGDRVRAGDVVARLDPQDLKLQVQSAEAELSAAESNLAQAAADHERYTALRTRGYASVADFDRKKWAKDEAEGRVWGGQGGGVGACGGRGSGRWMGGQPVWVVPGGVSRRARCSGVLAL